MNAHHGRRRSHRAALAGAVLALGACAAVPPEQLAFVPAAAGAVASSPLPCGDASPRPAAGAAAPLPGPLLRVLSWNLHKNGDPGWDADLAAFAAANDLLLIQEAALTPRLQGVLGAAGHEHWMLAGSWGRGEVQTGVLNAARVAPVAACVLRAFEPLLALPKAALVARYRIEGSAAQLAVANLHAINFTLGVGAYQEQLGALVAALDGHRGPLIVGGDFNSWSAARRDAMHAALAPLGLTPVAPRDDARVRAFGQPIDHLFVRGFEVVAASAPAVASSDHNPVRATLRLMADGYRAAGPGAELRENAAPATARPPTPMNPSGAPQ